MLSVVIKKSGAPLSLTGAARKVVACLDPTLPLAKVRTLGDVVASAATLPRFLTLIPGMFSLLAPGAQPRRVLRQVMVQGRTLSLFGITRWIGRGVCIGPLSGRNAVWSFKD